MLAVWPSGLLTVAFEGGMMECSASRSQRGYQSPVDGGRVGIMPPLRLTVLTWLDLSDRWGDSIVNMWTFLFACRCDHDRRITQPYYYYYTSASKDRRMDERRSY